MPFPLDAEFVTRFAEGLETILVVEEKRSFLEMQLREILYDQPHTRHLRQIAAISSRRSANSIPTKSPRSYATC